MQPACAQSSSGGAGPLAARLAGRWRTARYTVSPSPSSADILAHGPAAACLATTPALASSPPGCLWLELHARLRRNFVVTSCSRRYGDNRASRHDHGHPTVKPESAARWLGPLRCKLTLTVANAARARRRLAEEPARRDGVDQSGLRAVHLDQAADDAIILHTDARDVDKVVANAGEAYEPGVQRGFSLAHA